MERPSLRCCHHDQDHVKRSGILLYYLVCSAKSTPSTLSFKGLEGWARNGLEDGFRLSSPKIAGGHQIQISSMHDYVLERDKGFHTQLPWSIARHDSQQNCEAKANITRIRPTLPIIMIQGFDLRPSRAGWELHFIWSFLSDELLKWKRDDIMNSRIRNSFQNWIT